MTKVQNYLQSIDVRNKELKGVEKNILNEASGKAKVSTGTYLGNSSNIFINTKRVETEYTISNVCKSTSGLSKESIKATYNGIFEKYFNPFSNTSLVSKVGEDSGVKAENHECIANLVNDLIKNIKGLQNDSQNSSFNSSVFTAAERLESKLKEANQDFKSVFIKASEKIKTDLQKVNDTLKNLGNLNNLISSASNPDEYLDRRDSLLGELSEYIEFDINYGNKGQANISLNGKEIVDSYGKSAILSVDNFGTDIGNSNIIFKSIMYGSSSAVSITSGEIGGISSFLQNELQATHKNMSDYVRSISEAFNKSNAYGVRDGGSKTLKSLEKLGLDEVFSSDMSKTTIGIVNNDGSSVNGITKLDATVAKIIPKEFDFNGKSAKQIKQEINEHFHIGAQGNHIDIGGLTNVRLSKTHLNGNQLDFGVEFENGDVFGKKIQVTDVVVTNNGGNVINGALIGSSPGLCELEPGKCGESERKSTVSLVGGGGDNGINYTVAVTFQIVTEETGDVQYCTANFPIIKNNYTDGQYYSCATATNANAIGGGANVHVNGYAPVMRAKLVNDKGYEISDGSTEKGYLQIDSVAGGVVAFDDKNDNRDGLISRLGLSHIFSFDNENPLATFKIKDDLKAEYHQKGFAQLVNTSKLIKNKPVTANKETGAKAKIELDCSGFPGANIANNDTFTITINGIAKTLTFGVGPGQINQAGLLTPDLLIDAIVAKLNEKNDFTSDLSSVLNFRRNGDNLVIESKFGGTYSNAVAVTWTNAGGGAFIPNVVGGGGMVSGNAQNLANGTAAPQQIQKDSVSFDTTSDSESIASVLNVLENKRFDFKDEYGVVTSATLSSMNKISINKYIDITEKIYLEQQVNEKRLEISNTSHDDIAKIDIQELKLKMEELYRSRMFIMAMIEKMNEFENRTMSIIAAA